jgi:hypothetical protein
MICAAKNDEKEMFEKLVQNATEAKNLPDNFIGLFCLSHHLL